MNAIEREAVILNSAWEMIDEMVNWAMFVENARVEPTNLMFKTDQSAQLFIILLGDFLSQVHAHRGGPVPLGLVAAPDNARPSERTFLFHLRQVCAHPMFDGDATGLRREIDTFSNWLENEFVAPGVNLSAIDIVADLRIPRYRYLKMCGDIAKHNLARLSVNVRYLRQLLEVSGHQVGENDAYLAIEEFFNWFQNDIFLYHSSQIAEFLNNIRWEIFGYLQTEFQRSWHLKEGAIPDLPAYGYQVPNQITEPIARAMYWSVMNRVRARPRVHRFIVADVFKQRY